MKTRIILSAMFLAVVLALNPVDGFARDFPNQGNFVGGTDKERHALVVDIDGALTTYVLNDFGPTNGMFLDTGVNFTRDGSVLLMNLYYRLGYDIVYICGRPKNMDVNGVPMGDATLQWLYDKGYPTEPDRTVLILMDSPDSVTNAANRGKAMADYVGEHGEKMFSDMLKGLRDKTSITYDYAYSDSDLAVNAFQSVGVPADHIFTIGNLGVSRLGYKGSQPILGPEPNPGFGQHILDYVIPKVPAVGQ